MNIHFDAGQLAQLASGFQRLCGIRMRVCGSDGVRICDGGPCAPFCKLLGARPEGCAGCSACAGGNLDADGPRVRRCQAGLCTAQLPIRGGERREPLAWLCAGPFLDEAPIDEQWLAAREAAGSRAVDVPALHRAFRQLRQLDATEQQALSTMLEAMADSVRLRGLILPSGESDLRRLERFLDAHYAEKLSLASISAQLHIGRTRLCALAKQLSGGQTLFAMIARKRIDAAKALLIQSDRPVSAIAEAVGISDYNYFSKIFRAAVGTSPSEFRKRSRCDLDKMV